LAKSNNNGMKNLKNKRTAILAVVLIGLLAVAYKVMFMAPSGADSSADQNVAASARVELLLRQVNNIKFDVSVVQNDKFKSLKNLELSLPSVPVGRRNPFASVYGSN
jgi:hypothetical protein